MPRNVKISVGSTVLSSEMPPIWCFDKLLTLRKIFNSITLVYEQKTGNKDILHMSMASSMPEYLTVQNSGSMKSLTEYWVGYERLVYGAKDW
jgi:hypothetical protein